MDQAPDTSHPHRDTSVTPLAVTAADAARTVRLAETRENVDPDLILTEPTKADRSKPVKVFSVEMPDGISNMLYGIGDFGSRMRFSALQALPGFVVNHSSNTIGATQLVGEALYFKSSGVNKFVKDEHRGTWRAVTHAPLNVVEGVFKKSAFHVDMKQLLNPKYMGEEIDRFFHLEKAAAADLARDGKLSNRWSARSGFSGMTSMAISAALPDEKDNPETTERLALMRARHPVGYVGYRLGKGLMFPIMVPVRLAQTLVSPGEDHHIGDGKREFAGIGMTMTGLFSVLAGFRQPRQLGNLWKYEPNLWQSVGGMITTFAGTQLLTGIDNQQGWTNYGKTQFGRLVPLYFNIKERFPNADGWGDPNAKFYLGAQAVFQVKNVVASLIGGAQKLPDGTILDQKKVRAEAQGKARAVEPRKRVLFSLPHHSDTVAPDTVITGATQVERAMPERVEAQKEAAASIGA